MDHLTRLPAPLTPPGARRVILSDLPKGEYFLSSSPSCLNVVVEGEEIYEFGRTRVRVRAGEMILVQSGQQVRMILEGRAAVRAICVCLPDLPMRGPAVVVSAASSELGRRLLAARDGQCDPGRLVHDTARDLPGFAAAVEQRLDSIPARRFGTRQRLLQRLERAAAALHADPDQASDLAQLAETAGMALHHFARSFAAAYGVPPARYRQRIRIERAAGIMEEGTAAADVAARFGFADQASFSRAFRREMGSSPAAWARARRSV